MTPKGTHFWQQNFSMETFKLINSEIREFEYRQNNNFHWGTRTPISKRKQFDFSLQESAKSIIPSVQKQVKKIQKVFEEDELEYRGMSILIVLSPNLAYEDSNTYVEQT